MRQRIFKASLDYISNMFKPLPHSPFSRDHPLYPMKLSDFQIDSILSASDFLATIKKLDTDHGELLFEHGTTKQGNETEGKKFAQDIYEGYKNSYVSSRMRVA